MDERFFQSRPAAGPASEPVLPLDAAGVGHCHDRIDPVPGIFRFVIYVPFPWSEECARYLMIWTGMLGSVIALEKQRHIGVTFLVEKLPRHLESMAFVLVQAGMALFLAVFCWQGIRFAGFNADQASPAMEISMLIPFSAIPAGCAMMIIVIVDNLLSRAVSSEAGGDASPSAPSGSGRN